MRSDDQSKDILKAKKDKNTSVKLTEGTDYYLNEEGLLVFTAEYHLKRGYCCGNGCKHCPYEWKAVPVDKRSEINKRPA